MIRPAEIRALYSKLVEGGPHPKDDPRQILAAALKSEMERFWKKERVPTDSLTSSIEHQGASSFSVLIKWRGTPVARIFNDTFVLLDSRFSLGSVNRAFLIEWYLADDFPELKKPEVKTGA